MENLSFNQWNAYLLYAQGHKEQFILYCQSCKFTLEQINEVLELLN